MNKWVDKLLRKHFIKGTHIKYSMKKSKIKPKILKIPKKELMCAVMYTPEAWNNAKFDLLSIEIDKLFDKLKQRAKQNLAQERFKKNQDGVMIRAWIVPSEKLK